MLRDADADAVEPTMNGRATRDGSAESVVVSATFHAAVEAAHRSLPQHHRGVIDLVDIQGLTCDEAAQALGVPAGTVMDRGVLDFCGHCLREYGRRSPDRLRGDAPAAYRMTTGTVAGRKRRLRAYSSRADGFQEV